MNPLLGRPGDRPHQIASRKCLLHLGEAIAAAFSARVAADPKNARFKRPAEASNTRDDLAREKP